MTLTRNSDPKWPTTWQGGSWR